MCSKVVITPERVGSQLPTGVASNAIYAKHVVGNQMFVCTYNIVLYEIEGGIENANLRTHFEHNKKRVSLVAHASSYPCMDDESGLTPLGIGWLGVVLLMHTTWTISIDRYSSPFNVPDSIQMSVN